MTYTIATRHLAQALDHLRAARASVYLEKYEHHEEIDEVLRDCAEIYAEVYGKMESEDEFSERICIQDFDDEDLEQIVNLGRSGKNWDRP